MGSSNPDNPLESWAGSPRELRVGELLNEFLDLRASGQPVPPADFLKRHPEFAEDLSRHFEGLGLLENIGAMAPGGSFIPAVVETQAIGETIGRQRDSGEPAFPAIDGYELMRELGRGGMGVVYKALQQSTHRVCALKLLIDGPVASAATRKRFEREIALSAALKHPNIVPIYESGEADGRMYYAMEYVHGRNLTAFAGDHKLPVRRRLELFVDVCKGVSHAHQRGVIHRDLKPSNILVDADGEPHIYDFGLAKAGSVPDLQISMSAQLVGTPAYMSPEQIGGDTNAIDTRTDVYALGIILFELLTGQMPYPVTSNIAQTFQNIAHADPARPSKINRDIDEDVETITLKALAKSKDDRYQSATELATDIERYLAGDAILARKASLWYLARKAISRHRLQALIVLLAVATLITAFLLTRTKRDNTALTKQLHQTEQQDQASAAQLEALVKALQREAPDVQQRMLAAIVQGAGEVAGNVAPKQPLPAVVAKRMAQLLGEFARPAASQPASRPALPDPADSSSLDAAEP